MSAAAAPRDDRAPARHRLEDRPAEALVAAREDERRGTAVEVGELLVSDVAERPDAVGVPTAAGEPELELRPLAPDEREGLQQERVVLVRPGSRRVEQER